jgi:rRNA biogenesis protein RRP5
MIKKFSSDPRIWHNYATFLFDTREAPHEARALLPRAQQSLPSTNYVDITSKFAQLEFKSVNGDPERGRTIFEGLTDTYPKRLDLWNVYLDAEIKTGSKEQVRNLFDRVVSKDIKVRNAKIFFKKWLKYEETHGDVRSQDKVKAKAAEFVRKHEG